MPKSSSRKSRPTAPRRPTSPTARNVTKSAPRAAYARPAVLGATMLLLLAASLLWAIAANTISKSKPAVPAAKPVTTTTATAKGKRLDWSDLPALMKAYGARRKLAAQAAKSKVTTKRFALTEADLTANTPSDERDPSYSSNGNFIAFSSNATPLNTSTHTTLGDKTTTPQAHYHLWIMNSDGSGQKQITGLVTSGPNEDDNRDQMYPSWDSSGNQIVYTDTGVYANEPANLQQTSKTELFIVTPFNSTGTPATPARQRITNSGGTKLRPGFNSSGSTIVFASNVDPRLDNTGASATPKTAARYEGLQTFDIFTISAIGDESTVKRITGTTTPQTFGGSHTDATRDTVGDLTDDLNPVYSRINSNLIYFSSDRVSNLTTGVESQLSQGRRIWAVTSDGTLRRQITDPDPARTFSRPGGLASDIDDYPAPSANTGGFTERLGFQSNSYIDASDTTHDLNIWSLVIDSTAVIVPPALIVGSFADTDQHLHRFSYNFNTTNNDYLSLSQGYFPQNSGPLAKFEDVLFGSFKTGTTYPALFASERSKSRVEIFNGGTGADLGAYTTNVVAPTGLTLDASGNLLVADSSPITQTFNGVATTAYYVRYANGGGLFTDGRGTTNTAGNGLEGITFGPATQNDNGDGPGLFVSSLNDGVLEYDGRTGAFLRTVVPISSFPNDPSDPKGTRGLKTPTGIAFGPDGDLYVCSQAAAIPAVAASAGPPVVNASPAVPAIDAIKRYTPTTYNAASPTSYTFVSNFVADSNGFPNTGQGGDPSLKNHSLNDPERLRFGPDGNLYVSDYTADGDATMGSQNGTGNHISRYYGPLVTMNAQGNPVNPGDDDPSPLYPFSGAVFATDTSTGTPLIGPSGFCFNPTATGTVPPVERNVNRSSLETNQISAPDKFTNSGLATTDSAGGTVGEDKSADREPSFSGQAVAVQQTATLAFASQRRTAASPPPAGTTNSDGTTDNRPILVNPYGGPEAISDAEQTNNFVGTPNPNLPPTHTHDIWTTNAQDFTPPILLAQSIGNLKYPVIAPGPQAPVVADPAAFTNATLRARINGKARTGETGLKPYDGTGAALGNQVTIGVVIQEKESGLSSVRAYINDAEQTSYTYHVPNDYVQGTGLGGVDESITVATASENGHSNVNSVSLQPYDDGPAQFDANGNYIAGSGHELEPGAVAGDGIYYCAGTTTTPATSSDFYIDVSVNDNAGNGFYYDNVWGFSTRSFSDVSNPSAGDNLFVSDYTAGQAFPYTLSNDGRYANMLPVESYFLINPGDSAAAVAAENARFAVTTITQVGSPRNFNTPPITTVPQADVWRIQCRGPVPQTTLNAYAPTIDKNALDYADFANGLPSDYPNHAATLPLPQAKSDIVWGAPYAGLVFAGPGTIYDASTQTNLSTYLDLGGRLFLSGQDILYSLTASGTQSNTFVQNELRTSFGGENNPTVLTANPSFPVTFVGGGFDDLHLPVNGDHNNTYTDAATNRRYTGGLDILSPLNGTSSVASATTIIPAYTSGSTYGQYITQTRKATGRESKVAFFGFGLEQVDRRYTTNVNYPACLDMRWRLCRNLLDKFFDTTYITGTVTDSTTNKGIPNFLVEAIFTNREANPNTTTTYIAQTDANGNYIFEGIPTETPNDSYTVQPATTTAGKSLNRGYRGGTPRFLGGNVYGNTNGATGQDFTVTPLAAGTLKGYVYSSNGTVVVTPTMPNPRSDDTPLANVPVLVKTGQLGTYPGFPNGGEFAEIVTTDASGLFTATNVPASDTDPNSNSFVLIPITVIINPNDRLESDTGVEDGKNANTETAGDIPDSSGVSYGRIVHGAFQSNGASTPAPRTDLRRRVLPDSTRPTIIYAPSGDTFFLNDDDPTDATSAARLADSGTPLLLPKGPAISGVVYLTSTLPNGTVNSNPVAGATVSITVAGEAAPRTTTTLADGSYTFADVPASTSPYRITAIAPAPYAASTYYVNVSVPTATTDDITNANIYLTKQDVSGTVSLTGGPNSPAGVTVTLYKNGVAVPGFTTTIAATSNPGTFTFYDVPAGDYTVVATNGLLTQSQSITVQAPSQNQNPVPGPLLTPANRPTGFDVTGITFTLQARDISGVVTLNGAPVAGASVQLLASDGTTPVGNPITTAANGSFTFSNVDATRSYFVQATITKNSSTYVGTDTNKISVPANSTSTGLAIPLFLYTIKGTVTLNGSGLSGVTVQLSQNGTQIASAVTGVNGAYTFANLSNPTSSTTYTLTASYGGDSDTTTVTLTRATTAAQVLVVAPTLQLFLETIKGTVTLNGVGLGGATVVLSQNGTPVVSTTTASDGSYGFSGLLPGTYTLTTSYGGDSASVNVVVTRAASAATVTVTAPTLQLFLETVKGTVTLNGVGLGGATVVLSQSGTPVASTTTASDGSYSFTGLLPGTYVITSSDGGDSASVTVTFARATTVAEVTITAPPINLFLESIVGRVTLNGVPFGGATVNLINASGQVVASTTSASNGQYQFLSRIAGPYTLRATATAAQLGAVGAGAGDTTQVTLTVTRGVNVATPTVPDLALVTESISGRVTLGGKPTSGISVHLLQNNTTLKTVTTNSSGIYTFSNLLPGSYTIQASQGGDTGQIAVTVARGDKLTSATVPDIKLFLETVTGKVTLNGKVLKGATVLLIKGTVTQARATTDATGSYGFSNLLPGAYRVRALYGGDQFDIIARVARGVNVSNPPIALFLETVTGKVTLNGTALSGAKVTLTQGNKSFGTVTTTSTGTYNFANLAAGTYTITATKLGASVTTTITVVRAKNLAVPNIDLKLETVSGQVLFNGKPLGNTLVLLLNSDESAFGRATTDVNGRFNFDNVQAGSYIVRVSASGISQDVTITVRAGANFIVPTIRLATVTPTPGPTPTPTPKPTGANTYAVGQTYQISIPYMDSTAPDATTTPAKAFNLPPLQDGTQNYRIFRYNAQTEKYEELSNTSVLRRGEGYFLRPESSDVSMNDPASDATRKPMSGTTYTVTLRNNPSISARDPHNGFNLIGSPFNPATYSGADFLNSEVITPDGHVYPTVSAAVAGLVLSPNLFTFDETTGDYKVVNGNLSNFQGYYVRTFVNGVKLVLKPSR